MNSLQKHKSHMICIIMVLKWLEDISIPIQKKEKNTIICILHARNLLIQIYKFIYIPKNKRQNYKP